MRDMAPVAWVQPSRQQSGHAVRLVDKIESDHFPPSEVRATSRLRRFLDQNVPLIDREMFSFLPEAEPFDLLYGPMRDYPMRGGKRFRSALVLLSCEAT